MGCFGAVSFLCVEYCSPLLPASAYDMPGHVQVVKNHSNVAVANRLSNTMGTPLKAKEVTLVAKAVSKEAVRNSTGRGIAKCWTGCWIYHGAYAVHGHTWNMGP